MDPPSNAATIAVIGASGFVGRRLIERLQADETCRPIAILRRPGPSSVEQRICDATDAAALEQALMGATSIVNCVAGDAETMTQATRAIAQAAAGRRLVHLSSMAVYGEATGLVDETHPLTTGGGWYAQAKIACETIAAEAGTTVILRPGCIHGPGSEQWTARIGRLLRQGRIGDLGAAGDGICNLIAINDVVSAITAALTKPTLAGQIFNLGDPNPGTWNDYFIRFALAIGATPVRRIPARNLKLEAKLLAPALKISQILAAKAKRTHLVPDPIPPSLLSLWRQDIHLNPSHATQTLAFPRTPPATTLTEAATWFAGLA